MTPTVFESRRSSAVMPDPRSGDEVVVRSDLPPDRAAEAVARGLTLSLGAIVEKRVWEDVLVIVWEHGRRAMVRPEDVTVVRTREERLKISRASSQAKQLADRAAEVVGYYQPDSVDQAFSFGRRSAYHDHKQLPKAKFLQLAQDHPYPDSLWRAYVRGWRQGRRDRRRQQD